MIIIYLLDHIIYAGMFLVTIIFIRGGPKKFSRGVGFIYAMKRSWWKRGEGILSINLRLLDKLKQSGGGGFPSLIFSVGGFL